MFIVILKDPEKYEEKLKLPVVLPNIMTANLSIVAWFQYFF